MTPLFVFCAAAGALVLVLLLAASAVGAHHEVHDVHDVHDAHGAGDGDGAALQLFSVRALAAGVAAFGLAGLAARAAGLPLWVAGVAALAGGVAALFAVAALMRSMLRLESDGAARVEQAVGLPAVVYLHVPAAGAGTGKVQVTLGNRTVELRAVTSQAAQLPTGADVVIVDVLGPDTVEVVSTPSLED